MRWIKSSESSGSGDCVEVALLTTEVAVRDSKDPDGPTLTATTSAWQAFVDAARRGDLDLR